MLFDLANGDYRQSFASKRSPFEDGVRTPIMFRFDGAINPDIRDELVSTIDIMPSVLKQVVDTALQLPGMDVINNHPDTNRAIFGEIFPGNASALNAPERDIAYRWVRQGEFKLITVHKHGQEAAWNAYLPEDALFNLEDDPLEETNLFLDPNHSSTRDRLMQLLEDWWSPMEQ